MNALSVARLELGEDRASVFTLTNVILADLRACMSSSIASRPFRVAREVSPESRDHGISDSLSFIPVAMPPWSLISPASRGIGFALARRVLQTTNAPVVATARKDLDKTKEELLDGLDVDESRLSVMKLDVLGM